MYLIQKALLNIQELCYPLLNSAYNIVCFLYHVHEGCTHNDSNGMNIVASSGCDVSLHGILQHDVKTQTAAKARCPTNDLYRSHRLFHGLATSMHYTNSSQWKFSQVYITVYVYMLNVQSVKNFACEIFVVLLHS